MKKLLLPLLLLSAALIFLSCSDDDEPQIPPGSTGAYDLSSVDRYLHDNLAAYNNRVVVLIKKDGQLIYKKEIGMTDKTVLPIASASKWLSASVIMALVDEHKLSLDDTVGKFLPIFSQHQKGHITVRQLFSHTSGFGGDEGSDELRNKYEYRPTMTLAQAVDSIAVYTPLINQPGKAFNYGSTGMQIGGRIAEVVSGKSWQALFNEKIGTPCNMNVAYLKMSTANPLIAGGARTNANDYLNFLEMIVNKGVYNGKQVLSAEAVKLMTSDQTKGAEIQGTPYPSNPFAPYPMPEVRYGMGNWLDVVDGSGNVLESSSPGLFGAHPWHDSKHHLTGIIFTRTQHKKSSLISLKIRQMVRDIISKG